MKKAIIFLTLLLSLGINAMGTAYGSYSSLASWEEDIEQFREIVFTKHAMFNFDSTCDSGNNWRHRAYPDVKEFKRLDGRQEKADIINEMIDALIVNLPSLTADQIIDELQRCLSVIGDNHSYCFKELSYSFPFRFLLLNDGYYCHEALPGYEELIFKKLVEINDFSVDEIEEMYSGFGSVDNVYDMRQRLSRGLNMPELLMALGVIGSLNYETRYLFEDMQSGEMISVSAQDVLTYAEPMIHHSLDIQAPDQANLPYWFDFLEESEALYIKVNSFSDDEQANAAINFDLINFCNENYVQKIIFDVRNNKGGIPDSLRLFTLYLQNHDYLNTEGQIFCLIDSTSLSAATIFPYEMKELMNITIVGSPTGSRMHCFTTSGTEEYHLQNSGFKVALASGIYKGDLALEATFPNVYISPTIWDYANGVDPLIEYVLTV